MTQCMVDSGFLDEERMRYKHIVGGLLCFGVGLFLAYMWSPLVVECFKGAVQPITLAIGVLALLSVVFDKTRHKKINLTVAVVFLAVGGYGFYDEYIAVKDLMYGAGPIALVVFGLLAITNGIKSLT